MKKAIAAGVCSVLVIAGLAAYAQFAFIPAKIAGEVAAGKNTQATLAAFPEDVFAKLTASGALVNLAPGSVQYQLHCRNGRQLMTYGIEHKDVFKATGVVALDAMSGFVSNDPANSFVIERGANLYTKSPSALVGHITSFLEPQKAPKLSAVLGTARVAKTVCEDLNTRELSAELPYWLPSPLVGELLASLPDPALHGTPAVKLPLGADSVKNSVHVPVQLQEAQSLFGAGDTFVTANTSVQTRKIIGEIEHDITWSSADNKAMWNTGPFKLVANQFTQVPRTDYVLDLETGQATVTTREFAGLAKLVVQTLEGPAGKSSLEPTAGKAPASAVSTLVYHGCQAQDSGSGPRYVPSVQLAGLQTAPRKDNQSLFTLRWLDLLAMKASLVKPDETKMTLFTAPELAMLTAPSSPLCKIAAGPVAPAAPEAQAPMNAPALTQPAEAPTGIPAATLVAPPAPAAKPLGG